MKYIIEIEDVPFSKVRIDADNGAQNINLYRAKGFKSLVFDRFGLDKLTPFDKALKEAYQKGFDAGQHESTTLEYQQGLDDAWKAARKIVTWPDRSLVNSDAFDLDPGENIFTKYSASRAIEKLKAYEEQQKADEIKVGDEVTPKSNDINWLGVVVGVDDTNAMVMTRDGYTAMYRLEILKKTDKHFSQVAELLKAMNGEQRNCSACEHDGDPRFCDPCRHNDMWQPKEVTE